MYAYTNAFLFTTIDVFEYYLIKQIYRFSKTIKYQNYNIEECT